ncbi:hypothetical protein A3Q56_05716 [Intoshia linei]|uniref:Uncharacterized protein n=1 Tax=Intoshia linei TaxID=1819745 RepID=A0A177AXG9_9BILA|nr:hypothetical protein A3Q56_05716 [Intoshia linei]
MSKNLKNDKVNEIYNFYPVTFKRLMNNIENKQQYPSINYTRTLKETPRTYLKYKNKDTKPHISDETIDTTWRNEIKKDNKRNLITQKYKNYRQIYFYGSDTERADYKAHNRAVLKQQIKDKEEYKQELFRQKSMEFSNHATYDKGYSKILKKEENTKKEYLKSFSCANKMSPTHLNIHNGV